MLVAQALVDDLELVSGDEHIRRYQVRTICGAELGYWLRRFAVASSG